MTSATSVQVAEPARRANVDATPVIVLYIIVLSLVPAQLVFPGLGAAGRPAGLIAVAMLGWWCAERFLPTDRPIIHVRIRWAFFAYLVVHLASVIAGLDRGTPAIELLAMDRFMLLILGLFGVVLVCTDGLTTRESVETVVSWAVALGAVSAAVGILQFTANVNLAEKIALPGLQLNSEIGSLAVRGSEKFRRAEGLTLHSLELGVVMASLMPAALHVAAVRRSPPWWLAAVLIAAVIPMSISKTGTLALMVAMLVYGAGWSWRQRFNASVITFVGLGAYNGIVPGLLGTIKSLFINFNDNSTTARTADYGLVWHFIVERPWFGRGPGTFGAEEYYLLDNAYLLEIIEGGWIGFASLVLLFVVGCMTAANIVKRTSDPVIKDLARALGAAVAVSAIGFATYDAMAYPTNLGILALSLGCLGALVRIDRTSAHAMNTDGREPTSSDAAPAEVAAMLR